MSITFGYKNLIETATKITENSSRPHYGTAYIFDNDLKSNNIVDVPFPDVPL